MKLYEIFDRSKSTQFANVEVGKVTCDSRSVDTSDVFVCIKGTQTDGHKFYIDALNAGASVIVCEHDLGIKNQIIVEDTRKAYAELCAGYFGNPSEKMKMIGVTGTNGKTTTCNIIKSVLEMKGYKVGLIGTIHNVVGDLILPAKNTTPDPYELHSLLSLMEKSGCEYVIMEVSSHAIDQKRIYGIDFDICIFTNISPEHLDYHRTMENYIKTKQKLFECCKIAVVNSDDDLADRIISSCRGKVVKFSALSDDADYCAKNIRQRIDGVDFEFVGFEKIGRARIKTPGMFSVYNALAAGTCCLMLGIPFEDVVDGISNSPGVKGRMESVETGRDFSVIIDYAHTPNALENVLKALIGVKKSRIITVIGCGGDRDRLKRSSMGTIAAEYSDEVIVTSDNPRTEDPKAIINDILAGMSHTKTPVKTIVNRIEAIKQAVLDAKTDDIVFLAGKGHETYQIIGRNTVHLDEREIVKEALENK